jgi:hypothetical protein
MPRAALIAGLYFRLTDAEAKCSSIWSIAGITEAMLGVPPREKKGSILENLMVISKDVWK